MSVSQTSDANVSWHILERVPTTLRNAKSIHVEGRKVFTAAIQTCLTGNQVTIVIAGVVENDISSR